LKPGAWRNNCISSPSAGGVSAVAQGSKYTCLVNGKIAWLWEAVSSPFDEMPGCGDDSPNQGDRGTCELKTFTYEITESCFWARVQIGELPARSDPKWLASTVVVLWLWQVASFVQFKPPSKNATGALGLLYSILPRPSLIKLFAETSMIHRFFGQKF